MNPNTGTAPIFRTRRDAEIYLSLIYELNGILCWSSAHKARSYKAWPVRYQTMFHMTNDSDLFKTAVPTRRRGVLSDPGQPLEAG